MKKWIGRLLVLVLCLSILMPAIPAVPAEAASTTVKVTYKGKVRTYKKKKKYAYVNNKKLKMPKIPIFMKSGAYVGPVNKLLKNSSLKVSVKSNTSTLTLTYGDNIMVMKNGSRYANVNGERVRMGAQAMYVTYESGKKKWVVPLKSVCSRLGISYKISGGVIHLGGTTNRPTVPVENTAGSTGEAPQESSTENTVEQTNGQIVLVLDAGHGGLDSGATGNGYREKNMALSILLGAKKYFDNDSRFNVYYTRTSDTYPSLDDRCRLANNQNADLFISIHINSASASAHGTETLYNASRNGSTAKNDITSRELADAMQKTVLASTGFTNRGLKNRTDLRVLNQTTMPACLIEYGFISNTVEARQMNANLDRYGKELYDGIVNFLTEKNKLQ